MRSRNFRLLWLSQSVSVFGDALVIVAIGLYVTRLTNHPSDVALVLTAYAVPLVLFLLIGGVIADRLPRQAVMVVSDLVRAVLHGTLALLIAFGVVHIWHMMVIGVLYGSAEAFFRPAYTGLVPQTVNSDEDIPGEQALGGLSAEIAEFASPALATALVLGIGGSVALGLDAATFLVSAALVIRIKSRPRGEPAERTTVLAELADGWRAVRERTWVLATLCAFCLAVMCALAPFFVLGASVSDERYGTEAVFGLASSAFAVGTIAGVVLGSRWRPKFPMRTGLMISIPWPAALGFFAVGAPVWLLYPILAVAGFGTGAFNVLWETALAQRIPPNLLSRVSAWDWMLSLALLPVGYVLAGWVGHLIGNATVLEIGGAIGSLAMIAALGPAGTRNLRRIEAQVTSTKPTALSSASGR